METKMKRTEMESRKGEIKHEYKSRSGNALMVIVKIELSNYPDIAYCDGDNAYLGQKNLLEINHSSYIDGELNGQSLCTLGSACEAFAKYGCEYQIGDVAILPDNWIKIVEKVNAKIAELKEGFAAYLTQEKIDAEKEAIADKNAKEEEEAYQRAIKNGLCPKCHTYCYGDCQAK